MLNKIVVTSCLMLVVAACTVGYTFSGKNGTLVRNSLVAQSLDEQAFTWSPDQLPRDYLQETMPPPDWVSAATSHPDFGRSNKNVERAKVIVERLHAHPFKGSAIRSDLRSTYSLIVNEGRGYCADYSKLFNAFAHSLNIPVREWGFGRDGFGSGHTFNEVYSYADDKWVFVDSYHGMMVEDARTTEPLSVLELRRALAEPQSGMLKVNFLGDRDHRSFDTEQEGLDYYAWSANYFYLMWGNNVFEYDADSATQVFAGISRALERLAAIALGVYPEIRLLETRGNGNAIRRILTLRFMLIGSVCVLVLLGTYLAYLLWVQRRLFRGTMVARIR